MSVLVVVLDLDDAYPQFLHGPQPYTERNRLLHIDDVACPVSFGACHSARISPMTWRALAEMTGLVFR